MPVKECASIWAMLIVERYKTKMFILLTESTGKQLINTDKIIGTTLVEDKGIFKTRIFCSDGVRSYVTETPEEIYDMIESKSIIIQEPQEPRPSKSLHLRR